MSSQQQGLTKSSLFDECCISNVFYCYYLVDGSGTIDMLLTLIIGEKIISEPTQN